MDAMAGDGTARAAMSDDYSDGWVVAFDGCRDRGDVVRKMG